MSPTDETALQQAHMRQNWAFWSLVLLLVAAMTLGGGGRRFPIYEMIVQLAAIPALVIGLGHMLQHENWRAIRIPVILLFAAIGLALLQVIPLPPAVWQSLPGREALTQAAALTGQSSAWHSWSINPELTVQSALSLIVPLAVILAAGMLDARYRRTLLYLAAALILFNLLVGFLQSLSGGGNFYLYDSSHKGLPTGLFANRNHMAQLLLMGMFLFAGLLTSSDENSDGYGGRVMLTLGILFILTFSIAATNSRTVSVLLIPALLFLTYQFIPQAMKKRGVVITIGLSVLAAGGLTAMIASGRFGAINRLADRYSALEDHRFEFWPSAAQTMWTYIPFGSGLGSFDMAFRAQEHLSIVGTHYVNNAHNDYLELAIETGIFGPLLLAVFLLWFIVKLAGANWGQRQYGRKLYIFAAAALIGVMIHSLIDYPLRSYAILTPASLLLAVFALSAGGACQSRQQG